MAGEGSGEDAVLERRSSSLMEWMHEQAKRYDSNEDDDYNRRRLRMLSRKSSRREKVRLLRGTVLGVESAYVMQKAAHTTNSHNDESCSVQGDDGQMRITMPDWLPNLPRRPTKDRSRLKTRRLLKHCNLRECGKRFRISVTGSANVKTGLQEKQPWEKMKTGKGVVRAYAGPNKQGHRGYPHRFGLRDLYNSIEQTKSVEFHVSDSKDVTKLLPYFSASMKLRPPLGHRQVEEAEEITSSLVRARDERRAARRGEVSPRVHLVSNSQHGANARPSTVGEVPGGRQHGLRPSTVSTAEVQDRSYVPRNADSWSSYSVVKTTQSDATNTKGIRHLTSRSGVASRARPSTAMSTTTQVLMELNSLPTSKLLTKTLKAAEAMKEKGETRAAASVTLASTFGAAKHIPSQPGTVVIPRNENDKAIDRLASSLGFYRHSKPDRDVLEAKLKQSRHIKNHQKIIDRNRQTATINTENPHAPERIRKFQLAAAARAQRALVTREMVRKIKYMGRKQDAEKRTGHDMIGRIKQKEYKNRQTTCLHLVAFGARAQRLCTCLRLGRMDHAELQLKLSAATKIQRQWRWRQSFQVKRDIGQRFQRAYRTLRKALYWSIFNFRIKYKCAHAPVILAFLRQCSPKAQQADKVKAALQIQKVTKKFRWKVILTQRIVRGYAECRRARIRALILMWRRVEQEIAADRRAKVIEVKKKHHVNRTELEKQKELGVALVQVKRIVRHTYDVMAKKEMCDVDIPETSFCPAIVKILMDYQGRLRMQQAGREPPGVSRASVRPAYRRRRAMMSSVRFELAAYTSRLMDAVKEEDDGRIMDVLQTIDAMYEPADFVKLDVISVPEETIKRVLEPMLMQMMRAARRRVPEEYSKVLAARHKLLTMHINRRTMESAVNAREKIDATIHQLRAKPSRWPPPRVYTTMDRAAFKTAVTQAVKVHRKKLGRNTIDDDAFDDVDADDAALLQRQINLVSSNEREAVEKQKEQFRKRKGRINDRDFFDAEDAAFHRLFELPEGGKELLRQPSRHVEYLL